MSNPRPVISRPGSTGAKRQAQRMVSPSEGNGARREGRRKSEHFTVPSNSGNRTRGNPGEGRECLVAESLEGNMPDAQESERMSTRRQRIALLAKQSPEVGSCSFAGASQATGARRCIPSGKPSRDLDEPYALIAHVRISGSAREKSLARPGPLSLPRVRRVAVEPTRDLLIDMEALLCKVICGN